MAQLRSDARGGYREREVLGVAVEFGLYGAAQRGAGVDRHRRVAVDQQFNLVARRAGAIDDEHVRVPEVPLRGCDDFLGINHFES